MQNKRSIQSLQKLGNFLHLVEAVDDEAAEAGVEADHDTAAVADATLDQLRQDSGHNLLTVHSWLDLNPFSLIKLTCVIFIDWFPEFK